LIALFFFVAEEATDAYTAISIKIAALTERDISLIPSLLQRGFIKEWIDKISAFAPISTADVIETAQDFIGKISSVLLGQTTNILKNLTVFLLHIVVFFLAMFYFLRDGKKLIIKIKELLPLAERHRVALLKKMTALSYGIIYGIFGAAIVQGILVGLGFAIVGVNNAAFWGAIAALLSPVPYIGTSVVWVPVVITLMVSGQFFAGLFLLIWGIIIVGMADNIVKPYLIGSSTALHPLAVLLVLLGGAFAFGLKGLLFGPFVLTLALAFLHIYALEYRSVLHKESKPHVVLKKKKIK
jgi:predicted PurR-regulated permease PerM